MSIFNPNDFLEIVTGDSITQSYADSHYLSKTVADVASGYITFASGFESNGASVIDGQLTLGATGAENGAIFLCDGLLGSTRLPKTIVNEGGKLFVVDISGAIIRETCLSDATGRMGILTTTPGHSLDVSGNINFTGSLLQNGTPFSASNWTLDASDNVSRPTGSVSVGTTNPLAKFHVVHSSTGDVVRFEDNTSPDTSPFVISENGSVGVGTTAPSERLQVVGTVRSNFFNCDTIGGAIGANLYYNGAAWTRYDTTKNGFALRLGQTGDAAGDCLQVMTINSAGTLRQPAMVVSAAGSVGVSTTTPSALLDVNGTVRAVGAVTALNGMNITTVTDSFGITSTCSTNGYGTKLNGPAGTYSASGLSLAVATTAGSWATQAAAGDTVFRVDTASNRLHFAFGNPSFATALMLKNGSAHVNGGATIGGGYINSAAPTNGLIVEGNVGVGITVPTAKLHVLHTGSGDVIRVEDETSPDATPFIINAVGNAGFGIAAPSYKLHVNGNAYANSIAFINGGTNLDYYYRQVLPTTFSGASGSISVVADVIFVRVGSKVTITFPPILLNMGSTPSAIDVSNVNGPYQPTTLQNCIVRTTMGGLYYVGFVSIASSGVMYVARDTTTLTFSGTNCGWAAGFSVTYAV